MHRGAFTPEREVNEPQEGKEIAAIASSLLKTKSFIHQGQEHTNVLQLPWRGILCDPAL